MGEVSVPIDFSAIGRAERKHCCRSSRALNLYLSHPYRFFFSSRLWSDLIVSLKDSGAGICARWAVASAWYHGWRSSGAK
jgi:hypothetical protein